MNNVLLKLFLICITIEYLTFDDLYSHFILKNEDLLFLSVSPKAIFHMNKTKFKLKILLIKTSYMAFI